MRTGISTACFYPMQPEHAMEQLALISPQCCELFFGSVTELEDSFTREIAAHAKDCGIDIVSLHPYTSAFEPLYFFSNYKRRTDEACELYKKYFNAMTVLGARYLVFHGDFLGGFLPQEPTFEVMYRLCEIAQSFGVQMSQENVSRCKSRSTQYLLDMAAAVPKLTFTLDIKQSVRSDVDFFQLLEALGDRVAHLHISDNLPGADCVPPGCGDFDFDRLLKVLHNINYPGDLIIELYSHNFSTINELCYSHEFIERKLNLFISSQ